MVKLFDEDIKMENRQSSKGNQLKFERDGVWYKADYAGYEGLAEYAISKLLAKSTLNADEYVDYELETIEYNDAHFNACKSNDFTEGWQLITLERLFKSLYGYGLNRAIYSTADHAERLKVLVDQVERVTGLAEFGKYMSKVLTIDALFLNEDRHTHNIAVLTRDLKEFKLAPIFDNGAGLLSDTTMDFPMSKDHFLLIDKVRSKTFSDSFTEQIDISEELYGENIHFIIDYNDVKSVVEKADNYPPEILQRVIEVIMEMRRRYKYLFK